MVSSVIISLAVLAYGEFLLPQTNRRADEMLKVNIKGEKNAENERYRDNVHYQGESGRTYYAERYDSVLKALMNVIVHEYDGSTLTRRIDAKRAYWDGAQWVFVDGATRTFAEDGERVSKLEIRDLPERPEDFLREEISPEDMNVRELRGYIGRLRRSGGPVDKYLVDLYFKFSFPFTNLIFAVLGAALASAKRKPSMATGFGLTLLISFTYYGILRIGQALGHSGLIPPLVSAWLGNVLFLAVGGVLLYRANQ
jgi:lipopolysaccharide export system permease protein